MKTLSLIVGIGLTLSGVASADQHAGRSASHPSGGEMTCGQMIAAQSELPRKFSEMIFEVANSTAAHVKLMNKFKGDKNAQAEARALSRIVVLQRKMGQLANRIAVDMVAMKDLAPSPEAEKTMDMGKMSESVIKMSRLQREFGNMLLRYAKQGEEMVQLARAKK